jgi:hypothetical protein
MTDVLMYFRAHEPIRLHPDRDILVWEEKNQAIFQRVAEDRYRPGLDFLADTLERNPSFKFVMGLSGTFLEQASKLSPDLIERIKEITASQRVEFFDETYYDSLVGFFDDKTEMREQVAMHRDLMEELLGVTPIAYRHTAKHYDNNIGRVVSEMGFKVIVGDIPKRDNINPYKIYVAQDGKLLVMPRHKALSHAFFEMRDRPNSSEYTDMISEVDGTVSLGYMIEKIGKPDLLDLWKNIPNMLIEKDVKFVVPSDIENIDRDMLQTIDIDGYTIRDWENWKDAKAKTEGVIQSYAAYDIIRRVARLMDADLDPGLKEQVRLLTQYRQFLWTFNEVTGPAGLRNPYDGPATASHVLTTTLETLDKKIESFNIIKKREKPVIITISAETGVIEEEQNVIQIGGQSLVIAATNQGLRQIGLENIIIAPEFPQRFIKQRGVTAEEYLSLKYKVPESSIRFVHDPMFDNLEGPYDRDHQREAVVKFQSHVAHQILPQILRGSDRRYIIHGHEGWGGGTVMAIASMLNIPSLFTTHNSVPLDVLAISINESKEVWENLWEDNGYVSLVNTGIMKSWLTNTVGYRWMAEITGIKPDVNYTHSTKMDHFDPRIIPIGYRDEMIKKAQFGLLSVVPNSPSPEYYPDQNEYLNNPENVEKFNGLPEEIRAKVISQIVPLPTPSRDPDKNYLEALRIAKQSNLRAFQLLSGLRQEDDAILMLYDGRLDEHQKKMSTLLDGIRGWIDAERHKGRNVQVAILGNGEYQEKAFGTAHSSDGVMTYLPFDKPEEALALAASSIGFGNSRYEPWGQNDQLANLNGALAVFPSTGGYVDKITELKLTIDNSVTDQGNGNLFAPDDWGIGFTRAVDNIVKMRKQGDFYLERNQARIMHETRTVWSLDRMIQGYLGLYERLSQMAWGEKFL